MTPFTGPPAYDGARARDYEARRMTQPEWVAEQRNLDAWLDLYARPGARLLDVPVGTGRFLPSYVQHRLQVVGVDRSRAMLVEADRKVALMMRRAGRREVSCWSGILLLQGEAEALAGLPVLATTPAQLGVCVRFANWLEPDRLWRVLGQLTMVVQERIALGITTSAAGGEIVGGALTHCRADVERHLQELGWRVAGVWPVTVGTRIENQLWSLVRIDASR